MKKIVIFLLALVCFNTLGVEAKDNVNTNVLYPVNSSFDVETDYFNYKNIYYNSVNATLNVGEVYNSTHKKVPVSISLALFDSDKKNIGVVNYCSTEDLESDYAFKQLTTNQSTPFYMQVLEKNHVANQKKLVDVAYVAVLSDNKYCKVGGKDNYVGLTIEEIVDGQVSTKVEKLFSLDFLKDIKMPDLSKDTIALIKNILIILIIYIIQAEILNALNKKMYNKTSAMAYVPIANLYLAVKLAFGNLLGKIYIIVYLVSIVLGLVLPVFPIIMSLIGVIAFLIVIIKLITKKYDWFIIENLKKSPLEFESNNRINNNRVNDNSIYDINKNSGSNNSNDLLSTFNLDSENDENTHKEDNNDIKSFFNVSTGSSDDNDKASDNEGSNLTDLFK